MPRNTRLKPYTTRMAKIQGLDEGIKHNTKEFTTLTHPAQSTEFANDSNKNPFRGYNNRFCCCRGNSIFPTIIYLFLKGIRNRKILDPLDILYFFFGV